MEPYLPSLCPSVPGEVHRLPNMPIGLQTTVIGSFPKPGYLKLTDWFHTGSGADSCQATKRQTALLDELEGASPTKRAKHEQDLLQATRDVIACQHKCGVDVVTDGEVRRENYIHYLCRHISGIDFRKLTKVSCRNGAYETELPTVVGKVSWAGGDAMDVVAEWRASQEISVETAGADASATGVKYTLPGPLTIIGTVANVFYDSEEVLARDLAVLLNEHVVVPLWKAGCKYIQCDEPVFARKPEKALAYGAELLDVVFRGVPPGEGCQRAVHICCGYPEYLDQTDYLKADRSTYLKLAPVLDKLDSIDAISIEDAHQHNDLPALLPLFKRKRVILGAVKVASSEVESVEEIQKRLEAALRHIDAERLIVAPDCGLAFLPLPVLEAKLGNMCAAAKRVRPSTA